MVVENFSAKSDKFQKLFVSLHPKKTITFMSYTKTTVIKNPSRKLEEHIRKLGVQKYLWLEELCSDNVKPTKVIHV